MVAGGATAEASEWNRPSTLTHRHRLAVERISVLPIHHPCQLHIMTPLLARTRFVACSLGREADIAFRRPSNTHLPLAAYLKEGNQLHSLALGCLCMREDNPSKRFVLEVRGVRTAEGKAR